MIIKKSLYEEFEDLIKYVEQLNIWSDDQIEELIEYHSYYLDNKKEAVYRFQKSWICIESQIKKLGFLTIKPNNNTWSYDQIEELKENYYYYLENKQEAEYRLHKKWSSITAKARNLGFITRLNNKWTDDELKDLKENYFYYIENKEEAEYRLQRNWNSIRAKAIKLGITSMKINKKCGMFLGCHVAERILSHVFKDVERMSLNNKGFDFICNKGKKIDSKASCLHKNNTYKFSTNRNKIADYFLCIGFDNRNDLNPKHIWLIKSTDIHNLDKSPKRMFRDIASISIRNDTKHLNYFSKYELTDILKKVTDCCDELKKI